METILEFLVNNYLWFLIISLILIFALIGYIVDTHEKKSPKLHFEKNNEEDINMETEVVENKSLKEMIEENEKNEATEEINLSVNEAPTILEQVTIEPEKNNTDELPKA